MSIALSALLALSAATPGAPAVPAVPPAIDNPTDARRMLADLVAYNSAHPSTLALTVSTFSPACAGIVTSIALGSPPPSCPMTRTG